MYTHNLRRFTVMAAILVQGTVAHAQDAGRVEQLEKELQALKQRVSILEAAFGSGANQGAALKPLTAWRQLRHGLSPSEVRSILGEPDRINGGPVTYWYYTKDGSVDFIRDKLSGWSEPR